MNWTAFFAVIGVAAIVASFFVAVDYLTLEHPELHKGQRSWMIRLFVVGAICTAVAAGLA